MTDERLMFVCSKNARREKMDFSIHIDTGLKRSSSFQIPQENIIETKLK
jgi:hypothetical protein